MSSPLEIPANNGQALHTQPQLAGFTPYVDFDTELERLVLGLCLLEPRTYAQIYGVLTSDCFYEPDHRLIFNAMHAVWQYGEPVDLVTVSRRMYDSNIPLIKKQNTGYYLAMLTREVVSNAHLHHWTLKLRELAARRLVIQLTSTRFNGHDVLQGVDNIQEQLRNALTVRHANDWQNASAAALSLSKHIDDVLTNNIVGISTGFPTLDALNGGFRPGQFIVIGARPSVGKSALMGGIAIGAAKQGNRVGILSLEMEAKDIFGRMVSRETGIPFAEMDRSGLHDMRKQGIVSRMLGDMAELPLFFSDTAQCTIHDIRAKAEQLKQRQGLDILLLDYLQLVEETDKYRSREQGIAQISRGLKMLAMNLEIPVIALSQLNRESEHRADKRPTMADLRESGAIEQDADIVMILHRDWRAGKTHHEDGSSTEHEADLLIYKWRNGSPADLKLKFEAETMRFSEAA